MRTARTKARWLVTAVAGATLSAGCGSTASSTPTAVSSATASPAPFRRQDVQAELEAAAVAAGIPDWKKSGAAKEVPVGDRGTYFMATYKKQGWTLYARHSTLSTWNQSTATVTEDACFDRLTDEEAALLEH